MRPAAHILAAAVRTGCILQFLEQGFRAFDVFARRTYPDETVVRTVAVENIEAGYSLCRIRPP